MGSNTNLLRIYLVILALLSTQIAIGQMHELGLHLNATNYIGEVGATSYVNPDPSQLGYGFFYKRNFTTRYAIRAEIGFANLAGNDLDSSEPSRRVRGLSFENQIAYGSALFEFNYLDFDLSSFEHTWTPYVFLGVGYHSYDDLYYELGDPKAQSNRNASTWNLPFGLGIKTKLFHFFVLAAEVKAMYSFSDNIDGSFPTFGANNGVLNTRLSNDWIILSGITLSYSFGRPPCYCN